MNKPDNFSTMIEQLVDAFTKKMQFTKDFNFEVVEFDERHVVLKFLMNEKLQGNILQNILHGGVTATVLDTASGMAAIAAAFDRYRDHPVDEQLARIAKAATVDLRIDYLRPGRGKHFFVKAEVLRAGNKITVVDSFLTNDAGNLLARGIGTYMIGM